MRTRAQIATVRRFNRLVTQRAGALEDHFLGRARPLGHSRVLYEIGSESADLRDLRSLLVTGLHIEAVHPESASARVCLEQYCEELERRFDEGFDPGSSLPTPASELVPPAGVFLVATTDGRLVGCGAVKGIGGDTGSIKRMWVSEDARGMGVGRRILRTLEEHSGALGFRTLRLETNRSLREAIQLYRTAGYEEVGAFNDDPYADHWFEKKLGST